VAGRAVLKGQRLVLNVVGGGPQGGVTFLTSHGFVLAGQVETGAGMAELFSPLPARQGVALFARLRELVAMPVGVAGTTGARQAQEGAVEGFCSNAGGFTLGDVRRLVAIPAIEPGMPTLERVSGLCVIELILRSFPVNELKLFSIMFGMTTNATAPRPFRADHPGMPPASLFESLADLLMAVKAFEFRRSLARIVAVVAVRRTGEKLVRLRQRARRDLSPCRPWHHPQAKADPERHERRSRHSTARQLVQAWGMSAPRSGGRRYPGLPFPVPHIPAPLQLGRQQLAVTSL